MGKMRPQDAIATNEGYAFMTINGRNEELFNAIEIQVNVKKNKADVKPIGQRMKGSKTTSAEGTGTLKIYDTSSVFKEKMVEYIRTGVDFYFDLSVTSYDATSAYGKETVVYKNCNFDEIDMSNLSNGDDVLESEMGFTFDDMEILSKR